MITPRMEDDRIRGGILADIMAGRIQAAGVSWAGEDSRKTNKARPGGTQTGSKG